MWMKHLALVNIQCVLLLLTLICYCCFVVIITPQNVFSGSLDTHMPLNEQIDVKSNTFLKMSILTRYFRVN